MAEVCRMRQALWPDSERHEVEGLLRRSDMEYLVLVAPRAPGALAGFAEVGLRDYAEGCSSSPVGYLEGIWVDPDVRRTGVATRLVSAGRDWARERGCTEFASDCALDNDVSYAFHRAAGFEEADRVICFRQSLDRAGV